MAEYQESEAGDRLNANLERLDQLNRRFLNVLAKRKPPNPAMLGPGAEFYSEAMAAFMHESASHPAKIFEQQVSYWGESLQNWMSLSASVNDDEKDESTKKSDSRFRSEEWQDSPFFKLVREQYLTNAKAVQRAVADMEGVNERQRQRLEFFSRQIVDMMSPANFLATNPEALQRAADTEGESLVRGLENLVRDLERNDGELLVTLADTDAFTVGENLATSEGEVVCQSPLFELIQYAPRTDKAHRIPLLIVPPWINKYYILDLKPDNSFIRWTVEQGFTVFVISWVNPSAAHREVGMDDYAAEGCLKAIKEVKRITGEKQINTIGYCIGGTLLALVLAYMAKTGDKSVRAATFFTTLTDFSELGELGVFIDEDFLRAIESEVAEKGYLPYIHMSRTFSFMRAGDLVYGPAVRSYLLGETPPAFDLLYWNGDSTNLPAKMTIDYLRRLCQDNEFGHDGFELLGETVKLSDVRHPLIAVACEKDHIANWPGSYRGIAAMGSRDKSFLLSESGHIAGIINPPTRNRYGHYMSGSIPKSASEWREKAEFHEGSWWDVWRGWVSRRSGAMIDARRPGENGVTTFGPAPGQYVHISG